MGIADDALHFIDEPTVLFKQFSDKPDFRRWLADLVFPATYETPSAA